MAEECREEDWSTHSDLYIPSLAGLISAPFLQPCAGVGVGLAFEDSFYGSVGSALEELIVRSTCEESRQKEEFVQNRYGHQF